MADAIRFVLRRNGYRAGKYTIGYQSCDDSTAQFGGADYFKCASNAKAYSQAADLTALIGPYNSYCTQVELPILNRASAGPLMMVGATTHVTPSASTAPACSASASSITSVATRGA